MNYVESFNFYGVDAKEIPCIKGSGAPTSSTAGAVGCFYMDTKTGVVYKCVAAASGVYTWKDVTAQPKMELLETITVGDTDLGTVVRDVPNLDAISLVVDCPATSTTGKIQPRFHYPKASGGNYATMHNVTVTNADGKNQAIIESYKRYGVWRFTWAVNRPEWGAAFNVLMQDQYSVFDTEMPYVSKITLITTTLPSGTTIKIYGVKRNEN